MEINIILNPKVSFWDLVHRLLYMCAAVHVSVYVCVCVHVCVLTMSSYIFRDISIYLRCFSLPTVWHYAQPWAFSSEPLCRNMTNACVSFLYLELSTRCGNKVRDGSSCH